MSSIGKTLAAACNWPADAVVVAAVAEVAAGAAASVVAAVAGALAAEVAAAAAVAAAVAAVAVASFSVAASGAWAAQAARLAGVAAHPGERAACARSREKRGCDGRRTTSGLPQQSDGVGRHFAKVRTTDLSRTSLDVGKVPSVEVSGSFGSTKKSVAFNR
jgi:hypothetical protein